MATSFEQPSPVQMGLDQVLILQPHTLCGYEPRTSTIESLNDICLWCMATSNLLIYSKVVDEVVYEIEWIRDEMPTPANPDSSSSCLQLGVFPPSIIIGPLSTHKFTIIFLHGRGWDAKRFSTLLLSTPLRDGLTLRETLPNARFIFPEAPLMRAKKYKRSIIHQWYEGSGDWEPESRGEMRPSIEHIHEILREQIQATGGDANRVVLAGFSQGCAMALMCLLLWDGEPLGAVVGLSGFMPLNAAMISTLDGNPDQDQDDDVIAFGGEEEDVFDNDIESETRTPLQRAIDELREEAEMEPVSPRNTFPFLSTPVFLGHGSKDSEVNISHGRKARDLLEKMDVQLAWHTYPELGHEYNSEMLQDVVAFLLNRLDI